MRNSFWPRSRAGRPIVASLFELQPATEPLRSQFEVMVRHLYHRLLNNEVFGDDAAARLTELAYALALPAVLVALFLFPAYHGIPPYPLERSFWSQACDHLFFVTYSFVIMGCAVIFQWEMLFPDALDVSVLTTLPLSLRRLLTGRIVAVALFLLLVQVGTSGLGCLFLPAVADQRCGFFRQLLAQVTAVFASGACIVAALVTIQAVLLWLPRGRIAEVARALVRVILLTTLMTILFLFPLTAHYLVELLGSGGASSVHWFPPFWFLGIYEVVMWGGRAPLIFAPLAKTGVLVTTAGLLAAVVTYPAGYLRRVRQLVEGSPLTSRPAGFGWLRSVLHRVVFRTPRARATAHLAIQTLLRMERLHLYLAMYVGLGTALVLSGVLALRVDGPRIELVFLEDGLRMAVPVVAFWAVAGMKTALLSPIGHRASWIFQAICGEPGKDELRGVRRLTLCIAWAMTLAAIALLDAAAPEGMPAARTIVTQLISGCGLPLILTELFFAGNRTVPFTAAARRSVNSLPFTFVRYFVIFPTFALSITAGETWAAASVPKTIGAASALAAACVCARGIRIWLGARPTPPDELTLLAFHSD